MSKVSASQPKPYDITVPESEVERVKTFARITDLKPFLEKNIEAAAEDSQNDYDFTNLYGIKPSRLVTLVDRLNDGFVWKEWEDKLRGMGEHLCTQVTGIEDEPSLNVHFIHRKCKKADAPYLLLVHGWPGSVLEFYKVAPILGERYNLVMPSIPGYAYSSSPRNGHLFTVEKAALAMDAVMQSLKVDRYCTQGGDWGFFITSNMAHQFPTRVRAFHHNMSVGSLLTKEPSKSEPCIERMKTFAERGTAYQAMHIQSPYTIGAMLISSPVAILAYIGEKFYRWSAQDTLPSPDEIIANCLLYFFNGSTTSSTFLYYTFQGQNMKGWRNEGTDTPGAFGGGPHDILYTNEEGFRLLYRNVVHFRLLKAGGHFAALEVPELLAADVIEFMESDKVKASLAKN